MKLVKETGCYPIEMRLKVDDIDEKQGIVSFYFSAFGVLDSYRDITVRGAFAKTIQENMKRIKHFKNHNLYQLVGVPESIEEDSFGAKMRSKLIMGTSLGRDTFEEYKAGGITEHSFGYEVIKNEVDERENINYLKEVKLYEASSLTAWGANPETPVTELKEAQLEIMLERLCSLKKGNFTDEYYARLEAKIKQIHDHLLSLRKTTEKPDPQPTEIEIFRKQLKFLK